MQEEVTTQTAEESAPVSEAIEEQTDISKKYTPTQMAQARQKHVKYIKTEIEYLKVDVEFQELQIAYHENAKKIAAINEELQEMRRKADSADFKSKIAI